MKRTKTVLGSFRLHCKRLKCVSTILVVVVRMFQLFALLVEIGRNKH